MDRQLWLAATAVALAAGAYSQPAWSQVNAVSAGTLTCNVADGWGFVFGSSRDLKCTYTHTNGKVERYTGHVDQFGVDIGYTAGAVMIWSVLAPTAELGNGALAGTYAGATAGATVGVGGSANLLVGGSGSSISLQPLSVQGMAGLNVAAGFKAIVLQSAT